MVPCFSSPAKAGAQETKDALATIVTQLRWHSWVPAFAGKEEEGDLKYRGIALRRLRPDAAIAGRAHHGVDEADALQPVLHRGEDHLRRHRLPLRRRADRRGRLAIDVGEAFQIALGMARRHARHPRRRRARPGAAARQLPRRLAEGRIAQVVGILLRSIRGRPWCRRRAASARSRCPAPPGSPRACPCAPPLKRSRTLALSSSLPPRHEGGEVGQDAVQLQPADEAGEIVGMGADIADAPPAPAALGIGAPCRLLVAGGLDPLGQPVLRDTRPARRGSCRARRRATIARACRTIG